MLICDLQAFRAEAANTTTDVQSLQSRLSTALDRHAEQAEVESGKDLPRPSSAPRTADEDAGNLLSIERPVTQDCMTESPEPLASTTVALRTDAQPPERLFSMEKPLTEDSGSGSSEPLALTSAALQTDAQTPEGRLSMEQSLTEDCRSGLPEPLAMATAEIQVDVTSTLGLLPTAGNPTQDCDSPDSQPIKTAEMPGMQADSAALGPEKSNGSQYGSTGRAVMDLVSMRMNDWQSQAEMLGDDFISLRDHATKVEAALQSGLQGLASDLASTLSQLQLASSQLDVKVSYPSLANLQCYRGTSA